VKKVQTHGILIDRRLLKRNNAVTEEKLEERRLLGCYAVCPAFSQSG
jgi:hypothetical protein